MSWKLEIFGALFAAFGAMQTISNSIYLTKCNGLEPSRTQHRELPPTANRRQLKTKVICMLIFGILFLLIGLHSHMLRSFQYWENLVLLILFAIYATIEGFIINIGGPSDFPV